ncbi:putative bifunctional diguanylate cyclase/phosphodiesterase [Amycolatopsis sp. NPDC059657]|uniref:putative bifunctional diguanylate cyclase/phosphodiesterase n=1 Tax=Amycolatopsis sp. NPDC059657 TaxID=3346899 RepID=UPI003671F593
MTVPHPENDAWPTASSPYRSRDAVARKWAYLISMTAYLPYPHQELEQHLRALVDLLIEAVRRDSDGQQLAIEAGGKLVDLRCVGPESLRVTMEVLGKALPQAPELRQLDRLTERVVLALGALTSGYSETLRENIQARQEDLSRALFKVEQEARRATLIAQAQFEQLFTGTTSGVALTDLEGRFLRVNDALAESLQHTPAQLIGRELFAFVHEEDAEALREGYRELLDPQSPKLRITRRFLVGGAEPIWVNLVASAVRDNGGARQFVTIIEDETDASLLQRRMTHQTLHDALTGLPNRQFFSTRLEKALRQADPATGITVYHLDLDGFRLITGGFGHATGDRLLRSVAAKLKAVLSGETAFIARLGGDEFGILIENTPSTPDVPTMIRTINAELSEPEYLESGHGVGISATMGVAHRPARDVEPAELLRAVDMTLRRAQAKGHRQWELLDSERDTVDRKQFQLAASMPGAWETGELAVVYEPLVRLADDEIVGVEALLQWNHPEDGKLPHRECISLADRTGLILPLGGWLLRKACETVPELPISIGLTARQAADPDLVGTIRETLSETGVEPTRLRCGFPASALVSHGDAADNLKVLADIGVRAEIRDFSEAAAVDLGELPVEAVRFTGRVTAHTGALVTGLAEFARQAGATVIAEGVNTPEDAAWWKQAGAEVGVKGS